VSRVYQTTRGWSLDYRDEFQRRHRIPFASQEEASAHQRVLDQHVQERKAALRLFSETITMTAAQGLDLYLSARVLAPSTRTRLRGQLARFLQRLGALPIDQITPQLIATHFTARATEIAPSTLAQEQINVRALFRYLVETLRLPSNPAQYLRPRHPRYSAGIAISYQQEAQLLTVSYPQARLRFLLALDAGLRIGELYFLRANHVDRANHALTVWAQKTYRTRQVPLTRRLEAAIVERLAENPRPDTPLIEKGGKPLRYPSQFVRRIRWQLPFNFRFHDLRHTFATRLAATGSGFHVIAALLGHAPTNTTLAYLHPAREELRAAVDRLEAANPNCQIPDQRKTA